MVNGYLLAQSVTLRGEWTLTSGTLCSGAAGGDGASFSEALRLVRPIGTGKEGRRGEVRARARAIQQVRDSARSMKRR